MGPGLPVWGGLQGNLKPGEVPKLFPRAADMQEILI